MDLNALKFALRVAELGSFSAVAREANVNHSSVSRAIAGLEDRLGLRLFQRTSRMLSVTAEGERYLRRIAPLIEELEEARRDARSERVKPSGQLRLTASVAYGMKQIVPHLSRLQKQAPDLEIELVLSDGNLDLIADRIDLAVRLAPAPKGDLISSRLHATRYHIVANPDWIARHGAPKHPEDISGINCVRGTLPGQRDMWRFRSDADRKITQIDVGGSTLISNPLAQSEACLNGLGPALLADWLVRQEIETGQLINLFPNHMVTATTFETAAWILYPSRAYLPAKVRLAIDHLRSLT
ncbi:MAG: LysR family transcriptional regulator [Litoreibacter sp.]